MLIMEKRVQGEWQIQRSLRSDNPFPGTIQDRSSGTRKVYLLETTSTLTTIHECGEAFQKKTLVRELKHGETHEMVLLTDHTDRRAEYRFRHEDE
jgi:hypothetical protein